MIDKLLNNDFAKISISIILIVTLGIEWDRAMSFTNTNDLRIDQSGLYTMIYFFANGFNNGDIHLGKDLSFPYGPMLYMKYGLFWPGMFWNGIIYKLIFLTSLAMQQTILLRIVQKYNYKYIFTLSCMTLFLLWQRDDNIYSIYFIVIGYLYVMNNKGLKLQEQILLFSTASLISLIKFPFLIIYISLMLFLMINNSVKKISQMPIFISIISFAAIWFVLCNQGASDFLTYLRSSYELGKFFSDNMQIGWLDEGVILFQVAIFIVTIIYFVSKNLLFLKEVNNGYNAVNISFIIFLVLYLYITFKHGVVRHDGHASDTALTFVYLLLLMYLILNKCGSSFRYDKFVAIALILLNYSIFNYWTSSVNDRYSFTIRPVEIFNKIDRLISTAFNVRQHEISTQINFKNNVERFKNEVGINLGGKTIDSWPDNSALAIFSDSIYTPRPMPFAFSSYSHYLTKTNAEFIYSEKSPEYLIFEVNTIDNHLPSMDDPLSWMAIYSNYNLDRIINNRAILKKAAKVKTQNVLATYNTIGRFNESINLPADMYSNFNAGDVVYCTIQIDKSILGKLSSVLYKIPALAIELENVDGSKSWYRFIVSQDGFILNPIITDLDTALSTISAEHKNNGMVKTIKLLNLGNGAFFGSEISVTFRKISIH